MLENLVSRPIPIYPSSIFFCLPALIVSDEGLTVDSSSLHSDRIRLWNEFNHAWLAVLQKQKDLIIRLLDTGHHPRHPESLIPHESITKMAEELVRLCDGIETHGLVDYQYGVWEEQIMTSK